MRNLAVLALMALSLGACAREADVASYNLSAAADQFEVHRRIVFYNGITGEYMLVVEGLCSIGNYDKTGVEVSITCKTAPKTYKKHFLGLSDNVTYFAEQIEATSVDLYHYRVIFNPSTLIPGVELQ